jgi:hypothetical protein
LLAAPGAWPFHLALAVLVLPRAVFLGEALFDRDLHLDWYPRALAFARAVRHGLPPLWDLSIGFGQPFLADPSGQVLYPPTWIAALLEPSTVYTLFALLHLCLAGAGATRLARASGLRRPEATVAGAIFMLSGPVVSTVNLWHHFAGLAWMPWVVLAVHRVVRRPGRRAAVALGACLGLQVLAGSADMVLLTALAAAAWAAGVGRAPAPRRLGRIAAAALAGFLLAVALSAGQWMPAVEMASRAVRRALPEEAAQQWSVPPLGLARLLLPFDGSGRLAFAEGAQKALFDSARPPLLGSLYLGAVPLALAAVAVVRGPRRRLAWVLAGLCVLAVLASLGGHSPVFAFLRRVVPGISHFRYPSKAMVVPALVVAVLGGHGLAALRRRRPTLAIAASTLAGLAGLSLLAFALLFGPAHPTALARGLLLGRDGAAEDALPWAARLSALAALALLAAALVLRDRERGLRRAAVAGVACCIAADLLLAHHDVNATTPASMLALVPPVLSAVDASDGGRLYVYEYAYTEGVARSRLGHEAPYAVAQPPAGIDPRPFAALALRVYPLPPVSGTWSVEGSYDLDLRGLQPLAQRELTRTLLSVEGTPAHVALLRVGAVRTIVALHRKGLEAYAPGPRFPSLFAEPILTFGVPGALPRARAVGRVRALEGGDALAALLDPGFDPAAEVVLSGPGAGRAAAESRPGPAAVRVVELRADRVRLEAELTAPGVVVLADAFDPGWRAWVDGRPAEVLTANVAFRGIAVPAGRHAVEMRYRPVSVALGLSLSAAGLVALTALARARRRVSPAAASISSAGSR